MEDPSWMEFQKRLTSLMDSFHLLLPEDKPQAIASVRESVGQMQSAVKQQLCSDAMRTVAAMAESLIQETYGIQPYNNKPGPSAEFNGMASPDSIMFPQLDPSGNDTNDILTSALYESLKTVNGGPEYGSPLHNTNTTSSYSDILNLNSSQTTHPSLDFREVHVASDARWNGSAVVNDHSPPPVVEIPNPSQPSYNLNDGRRVIQSCQDTSSNNTPVVVNCENGTTIRSFVTTKVLSCPRCGFKTKHRQNLHRHLKMHMSINEDASFRKFPCSKCDKTFKTLSSLKEHDVYIHCSRKTLKCPRCEKYFAKQKDVNRHLKTHDDERAFICHCGKSYKSKYHLSRHILSSHSK